jgi:hypothetical protein
MLWSFIPDKREFWKRNGQKLSILESNKQIEGGRRSDKRRKEKHYEEKSRCEERAEIPLGPRSETLGLWDRLKKKVRKKRK